MKFDKTLKPEAACSTDETRVAIANPYLDVAKSRLVATCGRAIVMLPVEIEEGDVSGMVNPMALAHARKTAKGGLARVHCNGACTVGDCSFHRPNNEFPNYQTVIDSFHKPDAGIVVSFDVNILAGLVKAAGGDGRVCLRILEKEAPMPVTIHGAPEGTVALLCPLRGK